MTLNARSILALLLMVPEGSGVSPKDAGLSPGDFEVAVRELEAGFRVERQKAGDSLNQSYILVGFSIDEKVLKYERVEIWSD